MVLGEVTSHSCIFLMIEEESNLIDTEYGTIEMVKKILYQADIPDGMIIACKKIVGRKHFNHLFTFFNPKVKMLHVCFYGRTQSGRYKTIAGKR